MPRSRAALIGALRIREASREAERGLKAKGKPRATNHRFTAGKRVEQVVHSAPPGAEEPSSAQQRVAKKVSTNSKRHYFFLSKQVLSEDSTQLV